MNAKQVSIASKVNPEMLSLTDKERLLLYEKIFSTLNAIVFVFDLNEFRMLWVNDAFKKILGYKKSTDSIPEDVLLDIYHPNDRNLLAEMRKYFKKNKKGTYTAIFKFRNNKGKYVWLCSAANLFRHNAEDSVFEMVGVSISFSNNLNYGNNLKIVTREKLKESNKSIIDQLTKREKELTRYFANGKKTKEIAEMLGLSFHTVNNHRKNILKKLGMNN
ncbi:MAG: PAS domain S-box protein, partial [Bacteroidetes bacterium]